MTSLMKLWKSTLLCTKVTKFRDLIWFHFQDRSVEYKENYIGRRKRRRKEEVEEEKGVRRIR